MRYYEYRTLVSFADTNVVGNVYFAQFIAWQGKCRESFLYDEAPRVAEDFKAGYGMITKDCSCVFHREAFAFEQIVIQMYLRELTRVGVRMRFEYFRQEPQRRILLAEGLQSVNWVNRDHRVTVMPDYLYNAIKEYAEDSGEAAAG